MVLARLQFRGSAPRATSCKHSRAARRSASAAGRTDIDRIMSTLNLSPEEFQSLATRITDLAARFLSDLPTMTSFPSISGQQTRERFSQPLPESGLKEEALEMLEDAIAMSRPPSPRFYGYVLGSDVLGASRDVN